MKKQNISVHDNNVSDESRESPQNIANIQQNFHFVQNIDVSKITELSQVDSSLANRIVSLYESQLEHGKSIDEFLVEIEQKNNYYEKKIFHIKENMLLEDNCFL